MAMKKCNLAFLPAHGAGHIASTLEFAKRLLLHPSAAGRLSVTFLLMPVCASSFFSLNPPSSTTDIAVHLLPDLAVPSPRETDGVEDHISLAFQLYAPHVKSALAATAPVALVIDFFATTVIDAARDLQIPTYVFFSTNATSLALMLHLPALHDEIPEEFELLQGEIKVPGLAAGIPPTSMPTPLMNKKNRCYTWLVYHGKRFKDVRGIIPNTLRAFEPQVLSALESDRSVPPIHPVGPVLCLDRAAGGGERHECLRWLDAQPAASVVFLCFGSLSQMTEAQAAETAVGIERSGRRFLWCLRLAESEGDGRLPAGFREATNGRGMVVEQWVPQAAVLAHAAVGGFVTHGGWNSCLESLWFGVPMVTWPMGAEQHLNAMMMAAEMGVAAEMEIDRHRGGWATAKEVEMKLNWLMGESEDVRKVRERVREMKDASRAAVELGGLSYDGLECLVTKFKRLPEQ
ncbi:UDP-glycosyltransferase 71C4 [Platanthera zijinensis]|uniref:Glycosyltransferase n=1 Tax=Platanthera zijinensis TaxID=2320716 RepID=A0AAP0GEX1_9ASPA